MNHEIHETHENRIPPFTHFRVLNRACGSICSANYLSLRFQGVFRGYNSLRLIWHEWSRPARLKLNLKAAFKRDVQPDRIHHQQRVIGADDGVEVGDV